MGLKATTEQRAAFADRTNTLYQLFKNGVRNPDDVLDAIQMLNDGKLLTSVFSTPREILGRFAFYAAREDWPVVSMVKQLEQTMPTDFISSPEHMLTIEVWLGDLLTTFNELAGWIGYEQNQVGFGFNGDSLRSDWHLRLIDPRRYNKSSVRWVEVNMMVNWDRSRGWPEGIRNKDEWAALQVMTAYAVHPLYPSKVDFRELPGAWLGGLRVDRTNDESLIPALYWWPTYAEVRLKFDVPEHPHSSNAVPEFREL